MTLIAGFVKDTCPILMGDLLISSSDSSDTEIILPTIGKISSEHLSYRGYRPTNLCQKVNLLSPKLAVAWAGTKIYATSFMREIIAANLQNNPDHDLLREVFDTIGGQGNLHIIGIYRNGKEMRIFDFGARLVNSSIPGFEWFKAEGSGYDDLLSIVPSLENSILTSGQLNKLEKGIAAGMHLSTALLSLEIQTLLSLRTLYGAGYEIVHPLGSGLAKFCDLTYLFWKAEENIQGNWRLLPFPFLSSNYSYHRDILIIRTVRLSSSKTKKLCEVNSDELHVIKPIYRFVREDELIGYIPVSFNCKRTCNIFLWKNYQGHIGAFATYGNYVTDLPPVIWRNEFSSSTSIDVNKRFIEESICKVASKAE